ncbi:hypothetical protein PTTG_27851, partial [Puccinia triticina 1-1 BBBD Race 1]
SEKPACDELGRVFLQSNMNENSHPQQLFQFFPTPPNLQSEEKKSTPERLELSQMPPALDSHIEGAVYRDRQGRKRPLHVWPCQESEVAAANHKSASKKVKLDLSLTLGPPSDSDLGYCWQQ